jgi:YggT family protein
MIINVLISIINLLGNLIILVVVIDAILSYFLSPFHPVRNVLDRILYPLLTPIRRVVPTMGMFDLSPLILIILVQVLSSVLIAVLHAL